MDVIYKQKANPRLKTIKTNKEIIMHGAHDVRHIILSPRLSSQPCGVAEKLLNTCREELIS